MIQRWKNLAAASIAAISLPACSENALDAAPSPRWAYVPRARSGVPLKKLDAGQRAAAFAMVETAMSERGTALARGVVDLEDRHPRRSVGRHDGVRRPARRRDDGRTAVAATSTARTVCRADDGHRRSEPAAALDAARFQRLHFAWAGAQRADEPHYYRIHGPTVLVEYDNSQDDANHIHTVWRDLENDFGGDLLRRHYAAHPADGPGHAHD